MKNIINKFTFIILISFFSISIYAQQENEKLQFSKAQLAQMLAPIALYPDSLLTHILIASTYPLEIVQAHRWQIQSETPRTPVESKDWDPSVMALLPFPKIMEKLSTDLQWTQTLGDAFLQDEGKVLTSIQSLRHKAKLAGSLSEMENLKISEESDNIVIKTIEREVVYVPYYDTRIVYGNWHWSHYPPVYWRHHSGNHYHHNVISWYPRVHISFNTFFSTFHWHNRHVIIRQNNPNNHHNVIISKPRRWYHNPKHRHNVAYRSVNVKQKYISNRNNISHTQHISVNKNHNSVHRNITQPKVYQVRNNSNKYKNTSQNKKAIIVKTSRSQKVKVINKQHKNQYNKPNTSYKHKTQSVRSNNRNAGTNTQKGRHAKISRH
ncbi:DUF3300 domain-containing protein [Pseudoalteromonas denitrificans]|uniref:DUF3300 domain-containing protein n=1 Tax=Pseudoalteromonas denitrificans DSM 6059 TaxID=1123010 RepID=A0A1I1GX79_9GAMM|nr:DUF3300 domain-containing protein [Pseudoalteromonas denitrificans]SFC16141.1 Protein of unknown function [Pseudoalteromonas denitrificans DSM 6059]